MNGLNLLRAVRTRDCFRCTQCDMTEAEHYHRFGDDLDVVLREERNFTSSIDAYTTLCVPCQRQYQTEEPSRTGSPSLATLIGC